MGVKPAGFGRKRASRAAIDGENGVIPCANTASPPSSACVIQEGRARRGYRARPDLG